MPFGMDIRNDRRTGYAPFARTMLSGVDDGRWDPEPCEAPASAPASAPVNVL